MFQKAKSQAFLIDKRCFDDFKKLQNSGMKIQITEFDMSLGKSDISRVFGKKADVTLNQVYQIKDSKIMKISDISII